MVSNKKSGFYLGDQKCEKRESGIYVTSFMGLGAFVGGWEEGVCLFKRSKIESLLSEVKSSMVSLKRWGFKGFFEKLERKSNLDPESK